MKSATIYLLALGFVSNKFQGFESIESVCFRRFNPFFYFLFLIFCGDDMNLDFDCLI